MAALQQPARKLFASALSSRPISASTSLVRTTASVTRSAVSVRPTAAAAVASTRIGGRSAGSSSSRPSRLTSPAPNGSSSSNSRRAYSALNVAGPSATSTAFGPGSSSSSSASALNTSPPSSSGGSLATNGSSSSSSAIERPLVALPDKAAVRARNEEEGLDEPEWVAEDEAFMLVAPAAWKQLAKIAKRERALTDGSAYGCLRVAVDSGGCHGYQDKLELAQRPEVDDYILSAPPSVLSTLSLDPLSAPLPVVVDPFSLAMLKGATLDFTTELIGSAFRVRENPQAKGAGCGCGVSWEAK